MPLDEESNQLLYQSFNSPISQINLLKSTQNFKKKSQLPSMDLMKNSKPQTKRKFVMVAKTSHRGNIG